MAMAMASRVRRTLETTESERPPPALTSDLLEEIFLRVASPADLARASAACVSFRRLIADHSFLRRYHSIHPPLLLGFLGAADFQPVEAPHPSAALARAFAGAADFSFDYLPRPAKGKGYRWHPLDVRDGRVLLKCSRCRSRRTGLVYRDLVVCDPLSRRYLLLPAVTDELLASVELGEQKIFHSGAPFIPSRVIEEETSFSVIHWMGSKTRMGVFIFSSVSGCWSVGTSISWDVLGLDDIHLLVSGLCMSDCFYWKLISAGMLIKLDLNSMQFCTVDLPPGLDEWKIVLVELGGSKLAMFTIVYKGSSLYYYTFSQNGCEKSHEWHMKRTIPLPAHYLSEGFIGGPAEGYMFLECTPEVEDELCATFSLEIKSFSFERVSRTCFPAYAHPYFGFPPSMSLRRIRYGED